MEDSIKDMIAFNLVKEFERTNITDEFEKIMASKKRQLPRGGEILFAIHTDNGVVEIKLM